MKPVPTVGLCLLIGSILIFGISCSLEYDSDEKEDTTRSPEFLFSGISLQRVENSVTKIMLYAEELEQYKDENSIYAKNVSFQHFDDAGMLDITGSCGLVSADNDTEIYNMFANVQVTSYEQDMTVTAENFKWNTKTEQMISGADDLVNIVYGRVTDPTDTGKTQVTISGTGFSASGVSRIYQFGAAVTGVIDTAVKETTEAEGSD
jgi:LPS export ABC transporter protein LptC